MSRRWRPWMRETCLDPDADEGATSSAVAALTNAGALCVALGGDNSITYAVASGVFGADISRGGLVTLDAHHDVREGINNGSPVRRLIEAGLPASNIVQIGIADFANSQRLQQARERVRDPGDVT